MQQTNRKPTLLIVTNNHFDQTWRRCWDRSFTYHGARFISYADLEEYYVLDNLALASQQPEYKFEVECSIILRKFLERHPECLSDLTQLARAGRFAVTGGGEAIIDGNMVHGESLVRNYVDGLLWAEEILDQKTQIAVRNDAFGNPAQLPQILRGCEIAWATGMSYTTAKGLYWRGLDGSTILHQSIPAVGAGGGNAKYPPCPTCAGIGVTGISVCKTCRGRGIDDSLRANLPTAIDEDDLSLFSAGIIKMGPEELLPNPDIIKWAKDHQDKYEVRFALEEDVLPYLENWTSQVDSPPDGTLHPGVELNPNNSGCLVTRIKTKQNVRRQEYRMLAVETLAVMATMKGMVYPVRELKQIRQDMIFTMFHDAITATHVDAAYEELNDYYVNIDKKIDQVQADILQHLVESKSDSLTVLNPYGYRTTKVASAVVQGVRPVSLVDPAGSQALVLSQTSLENNTSRIEFLVSDLDGFASRFYQIVNTQTMPTPHKDHGETIQNQRFLIKSGLHGIETVFDKKLNRLILSSAEYLPGELILEHDEGSPWATLSSDQHRTPLSQFTTLVERETGPSYERLWFIVEVPREAGFSGKSLIAKMSVTLISGLDQIEFQIKAYWDGFNHRVRLAMPVPFSGRHMYEVPYGVLERQPYSPWFRWAGANGDWPALNWAGVEGKDISVALFNQGTPSYKIEPSSTGDTILVSLLRSPAIPTYLHEPEFYTMTEYDGMRDMGEHEFSFAVSAYEGSLSQSPVVLDADAFNARWVTLSGRIDLPPMPALQSGTARISAMKWAEKDHAFIVRLVEFRGLGGEVVISLPFRARRIEKVNLLERQPIMIDKIDQNIMVSMRPWEIATLKFYL